MPIDFTAVAAAFQERFARQTHDIKPLFERLTEAIKKLDRASLDAERKTRGYPLLRYRDDAVCVTVDATLMPPLPRDVSLGFVDGLTDGFRRFAAELGFAKTAVDQELALPRLLAPFVGMSGSVLASLERFEKPTPEMFDPDQARFSDLFGVANLTWSGLLGKQNQADLHGVATTVSGVIGPLGGGASGGVGAAGAATGPPFQTTIDLLDQVALALLDAIVLLPLLTLGLDIAVHDGALAAEVEILTRVSAIEADVYAIRASIVDELITATTLGSLAQAGFDAVETWASINAWLLSIEIPRWTDDLLKGLFGFLAGISAWGKWVVDFVRAAQSMFEALMHLDLMNLLMHWIFPSWVVKVLPSPPPVTLDNIVGMLLGEEATGIRDNIDKWLSRAEDVLYWTPWCRRYSYKIADLRIVLNTTLSPTPFTYPPDVMPTTPLAGFPDVYDAVFGGGRKALLLASIGDLGVELRASVSGMFTGAATMAEGLSGVASGELGRMATAGSGVPLARFGHDSVALAASVFGPERTALLERQRQPSPLAAAFDEVMAGGGIAVAAAMIPFYVATMRRFWATQSRRREHPTSAHILARHGRLAMVRVPRLTLTAADRLPDEELATEVDARFRAVVGSAYHTGRDTMLRNGGRRG